MFDSSDYPAKYPHSELVGAGYLGVMSYGTPARFNSFSVYLNKNDMPDAVAAEPIPEKKKYNIESFDPVIVMYNNTSALLENITVQLQDGGEEYAATDVTWTLPTTDGLEISNGAGGTGYDSKNIFMNNSYYYAYIRGDYITEDGIKLSDLGVYNVSTSFEVLNPGTNISKYDVETDTFGGVRNDYNG